MMASSQSHSDTGRGEQIVRLPRVTDAIGAALRNAYGSPASAPDDMLAMLRRIDRDQHLPH